MTYFPKYMIDQKRWLVRKTNQKQPFSALDTRPSDYETPAGQTDKGSKAWSYRWNVPAIWASYEKATSYKDRYDNIEGLSYVLHPAGDLAPKDRLVCLDYDNAISEDGEIDSSVVKMLEKHPTFTELSRSKRGLHSFLIVKDCPAFVNNLRHEIGNAGVDVLSSSQIAVTGDALAEVGVAEITFDQLLAYPFFEYQELKESNSQQADWWSEDPVEDVPDELTYLISDMEDVEAIEGMGGSQVLFACAASLMKKGITGRNAEALLRFVPAYPPFDSDEIQRTVDCAYSRVELDGQFDTEGAHNEFPILEKKEKPEPPGGKYGFKVMSIGELVRADLRMDYLVDRTFIGEGALIIGGREKCFKTCLAMDLAISLAEKGKFLGEFQVTENRRVAFFTAEIGFAAAQNLAVRVLRAKGINPMDAQNIDIIDAVPSFSVDKRTGKVADQVGFKGLDRYFLERKPQVAFFDPLYWALGGSSVGDMYEIGTVLREISALCAKHGIWPIFCHHGRKGTNEDQYKPMALGDLYGAGAQQFARQWLMVSHAEEFRNGRASLYLNMGSSGAGDRGLWRLAVNEGQADEIIERKWDLELSRDDSGTAGSLSDQAVTEAIEALDGGKGATIPELMFFTEATGGDVERTVRRMITAGSIEMKPGKRFTIRGDGFETI